jgi:hypothetical protein
MREWASRVLAPRDGRVARVLFLDVDANAYLLSL